VVEVFVSRLGLDSSQNQFVVILQEKDGERILPIWIGRPEAESIAAHLDGVASRRPMTHDLVQSLIVALGGVVDRIEVTHVLDGTFYARLHLDRGGEHSVVDARPSDSIAIAIRLDAPIFVADDLLAEYEIPEAAGPGDGADAEPTGDPSADADEDAHEGGIDFGSGFAPPAPNDQDLRSAEQLKRHLERLRPEDFGKFSL
jgi:bifunctional DNase/RNase